MWWASPNDGRAPPEVMENLRGVWDDAYGDRRQELVFIGIRMNVTDMRARLDACLLSGEEIAQGAEAWAGMPDPVPRWERQSNQSA